MANNVQVEQVTTPDLVFATDDIGGVHVPYAKLMFGPDDTGTIVSTANGLPVAIVAGSANIGDVDVLSVVTGTGATNLGKAEDAAHSSGDVGVMALAVRLDTGATIAGADGDYSPLQVDADGNLRVRMVAPTSLAVTNAGTFAVQAAQSGTWNITNISGTISLPTGAATAANQTTMIGHLDGVETLLGTGNTNTNDIAADTGVIAGAVSGTEMQVDVLTSALPTGAATSAKQDTMITALELIDDVVKTEDAGHSSGDKGVMALAVRNDTPGTLAGTDLDYAPLQLDASGNLRVATISSALPSGAATAANQTTIIGHVDGIEALLTTIDADTSALFGTVAGSELQVDIVTSALPSGAATAANQATIIGHVDGIEGLLAGTLTVGSHAVTNAGTFAVQVTSIAAGNNNIGDVDVASIAAGNNNIGDVDIASIAAGSTTIGNVGLVGRTTGGLTMSKTVSAASTNATSVKGSAGQVFSIYCSNVNAAARYLKLYNKATAPTVGTDTPVLTFIIPGNTAGAGFSHVVDIGYAFSTGIAFALTTEATDAGTTGVAASEIVVNIGFV